MLAKKPVLFLRLLFYILFLSFCFSELFFFGIIAQIPLDLMFFAEKNANVWGFLVVFLVTSLTLYFLQKVNTTKNVKFAFNSRRFALGIGLLLNIVFSAILLMIFINFTKYNREPWLIQAGWFMRQKGIIWSIFLGTSVFSGIVIIDELLHLKNVLNANIPLKIGKITWNLSIGAIVSLFTLILSFLFSGCLLLFYRVTTLSGVFLFSFVFIVTISILYIVSRGAEFSFFYHISQGESRESENFELQKKENRKSRLISGFLLIVAAISLIIMVLYFFNITEEYIYPPGVNSNHFLWPIQQLLTIVLGLFIGIITIAGFSRFILCNSFFHQIKLTSNKVVNNLIRIVFGIAIFIAIATVMSTIGLGLYIFEFVLYIPQVISYTFVWAIAGVVLYIIIEKIDLRPKLQHTLSYTAVIIAFLLIITNFWELTVDLIKNSSSIKNRSFDIYFPFEYLFSNKNIIIFGLCMGFLLSFFVTIVIKGLKNTTNATIHNNLISQMFLFLAPLTIGFLVGFSSLIVNVAGGDPTQALYDSDKIISLLRVGLLGVFSLFILRYNIIAARGDKEDSLPMKKTSILSLKDIMQNMFPSNDSTHPLSIRKLKATAIISIAIIGVLTGGLGIGIGVSAKNARVMPMITSTERYNLWIANSSERFNHQTRISDVKSPQIDVVTFHMAKNEYHAFQLGLTLKSKTADFLTSYITDFVNLDNSSEIIFSDSAQLRYEDYILQEEFPDKLVPIQLSNPIPLAKQQTHMFWFDIRTPYNLTSGTYKGTLTIVFKMGDEFIQEKILIRIYVWDFAIPLKKHVTTNVGDASVPDEYFDDLARNWIDHRFNVYGPDISGTTDYAKFLCDETRTYYLNETSGDIIFNWTLWDTKIEYLLNSINAPMNGFRIDYGPMGRELLIRNETENQWFLNWLIEVEQHLDLKNWLNICYYYFVDEFTLFIPDNFNSRAEYYVAVEEQLASMKAAAPKIRIMVVAPPLPELERIKPYIDIYCPLSYDRNVELWEKAKAEGKEMWYYTCVGPFAPYPNVHLYNRLFEARMLMWNTWQWGVTGYLYWRANSYSHGQYGFGYNGYGDGWLIYEDGSQFYDSIRWENLGDGQEDYEMFWLLNATLNEIENHSSLPQNEIDSYRAELNMIVDKVADDFLDYTNNPHDLYHGIERIGKILHMLSTETDIKAIGEAPWYPISGVTP